MGIILLPKFAVVFPKISATIERKQKIVFQGRTGDGVTEEREVRIGISLPKCIWQSKKKLSDGIKTQSQSLKIAFYDMVNLSIKTIKKYSLSEYKHYSICWKYGTENLKFSIIIWGMVDLQKDVSQHQLHTPCIFFNLLTVNFICSMITSSCIPKAHTASLTLFPIILYTTCKCSKIEI